MITMSQVTNREELWKARFLALETAARELYYAAHWYPDRECDANDLWMNLRDAIGLPPGQSSTILGEKRSPVVTD